MFNNFWSINFSYLIYSAWWLAIWAEYFPPCSKLSRNVCISWSSELRREEKFTDQKSLNISSLQTDYLKLDSSSGFDRDSERAHDVQTECTFFGGVNHSAEQCFKKVRKEKEKDRAVDVSSYRQMERPPRKCFRCGSEDHMIENFPKQVCFNKKGNYACDNGKNDSDCDIYAYIAWMSSNDEWKNHGKTEYWDRTLVQEGW